MNETKKATRSDRQLVLTIKDVAKKKRLTVDDIVIGCEQNGEPVSVSTVRRILQKGSEDASFRTSSIVPVAHFVLSAEEDEVLAKFVPESSTAPETATADELREILRFREAQISEMRIDYADRAKERAQEIEFMKRELIQKDAEINRLHANTKRQTRGIAILAILLFLCCVIAIGYLTQDLTHPTYGAFQWQTYRFEEAITNDL